MTPNNRLNQIEMHHALVVKYGGVFLFFDAFYQALVIKNVIIKLESM